MKKTLYALALCTGLAASVAAQTASRPAPPPAPAEVKDPHAGHRMGGQQEEQAQSPAAKYFSAG